MNLFDDKIKIMNKYTLLECNVCKKHLQNHVGSTECCGSVANFLLEVDKESSINDKIRYLGIEILQEDKLVFWKKDSVKIPRPTFYECWKKVKEAFGFDFEPLKIDGYYK